MKSHSNLLVILAAWFTTVGVAFFLLDLKTYAALANCPVCPSCGWFYYAGIYVDGQLSVAYGYSDPNTGDADGQAFLAACSDGSCNLYGSEGCSPSCDNYPSGNTLNVTSYAVPNLNCKLPAGATPCDVGFNGGTRPTPAGTVSQQVCTENGS